MTISSDRPPLQKPTVLDPTSSDERKHPAPPTTRSRGALDIRELSTYVTSLVNRDRHKHLIYGAHCADANAVRTGVATDRISQQKLVYRAASTPVIFSLTITRIITKIICRTRTEYYKRNYTPNKNKTVCRHVHELHANITVCTVVLNCCEGHVTYF